MTYRLPQSEDLQTSSTPSISLTSTSVPAPNPSHQSARKLCLVDLIKVALEDGSTSIVKIHSCSGKTTGAWANSWDITNASGTMRSFYFKRDLYSWEFVSTEKTPANHEFISTEFYQDQMSDDIATAMQIELAERALH